MRALLRVLIIIIAVAAAFLARQCSSGKALLDAGRGYVNALVSHEDSAAYGFLSDSLAGLIVPEILAQLPCDPLSGGIRTGRMESRGFTLYLPMASGGSRTLWLRRDPGMGWRITGDSSLDNLLGNATVICSSYARNTVIPALAAGAEPGDYMCPVCGTSYSVAGGRLMCESGHLGEGIDIGGSACGSRRDSLACMVEEYVDQGYDFPSSFAEMYQQSGGEFGQPGGFRCPDDGYSYYQITEEGVYCPFHDRWSIVDLPMADLPATQEEQSQDRE